MKVECMYSTGIGFSEYTLKHMRCTVNTKREFEELSE